MNTASNLISALEPLPPFSIDTRTLQKGDLFIALDGERQKGHTFLADAFRKGAAGALASSGCRQEVQSQIAPHEFSKVYFLRFTMKEF